jgi:hypothetical protein
MLNHEQKQKLKKMKTQDFIGKSNLLLALGPSALGNFSHVATYRNFSKNLGKINFE